MQIYKINGMENTMKILFEDFEYYSVGDIIKVKQEVFRKFPGKELIETGHLFVIVSEEDGTVCEISSQDKVNERFPWNVAIQDWEHAGLRKASHVKTDTSGKLEGDDRVCDYIGHLSASDLENVLNAYRKAPQNVKLEWISK